MCLELQERVSGAESELKARCVEVEALRSQLSQEAPVQAGSQVTIQ